MRMEPAASQSDQPLRKLLTGGTDDCGTGITVMDTAANGCFALPIQKTFCFTSNLRQMPWMFSMASAFSYVSNSDEERESRGGGQKVQVTYGRQNCPASGSARAGIFRARVV